MTQKSTCRDENLLTPGDVASRLRVSQRQIYNLVSTNGFPSPMKVGRQNRWREIDVANYLAQLAEAANPNVDPEAA